MNPPEITSEDDEALNDEALDDISARLACLCPYISSRGSVSDL